VAAAAASLARLTHREPSHLAAAVYMAQAVLAAAVAGAVGGDDTGFVARAARWGGADPPDRVRKALRAAAAHPRDALKAREAARAAGVEPGVAGAIVGIAAGGSTAAPADLVEVVRQVQTGPAGR
jgi:hypothetical protein